MPRMDQAPAEHRLVKLLLVGDSKIGKTYFAGEAAHDGFNLLYVDGDVGSQTLSQQSLEAQKRIWLLNTADSVGNGAFDPLFIKFMIEFTSVAVVRWNDTKQRIATRNDPPTDEIWELRPGKLDANTVLVIDSWTGLAESMMRIAAQAHGVNLATATTSEMRPVYQAAGLKSNQILQLIRGAPGHVIVLAHPDEYTHTTKPEGVAVSKIKEADLKVEWTKQIPRTVSKPQGMQMGKYFTDIAWMELNGSGSQRLINFRPTESRIVGGHFNDRKSVEDYSFAKMVQNLGGTVPDPKRESVPGPWLTIIPPGEAPAPPESQVLDGTAITEVKPATGLAAFIKKG